MLAFSTHYDNASLANLTGYILQQPAPDMEKVMRMYELLKPSKNLIDQHLHITILFLEKGSVEDIKKTFHIFNIANYYEYIDNEKHLDLLIKALILSKQYELAQEFLRLSKHKLDLDKLTFLNLKIRIARAYCDDGKLHKAEVLLANISLKSYFEICDNEKQIYIFINLLLKINRYEEISDAWQYQGLEKIFENNVFNGFKIKLAFRLIIRGYVCCAEKILEKLNIQEDHTLENMSLIGFTYLQLSRFKKAKTVFDFADKIKHNSSVLPIYKTALYICLYQFDKAQETIDSYVNSNNDERGLLWKAKVFNSRGCYDSALTCLEHVLSHNSIQAELYHGGLVDKGNILRSKGLLEDALLCFQKVQHECNDPFWQEIACFENSLTLLHLNRVETALLVALKGCQLRNEPTKITNPCSILYHLILCMVDRPQDFYIPIDEWEDKVCSFWPFPQMSYKLWMSLLAAIGLKKYGYDQSVKNIMNQVVREFTLTCYHDPKDVELLIKSVDSVELETAFKQLRSLIRPYESQWNAIHHLTTVTDVLK